MAVRVGRGLRKHIIEYSGGFTIQVKTRNLDAATEGLGRARQEIARLDGGWESAPNLRPGDANGPKFVGGVVKTPQGPFLYVDAGFTPEELVATIPDIVARHLSEAGVRDAVVTKPEAPTVSLALPETPRAVVLRLYPPLTADPTSPSVPEEFLAEAAAWVGDGLGEDDFLTAAVQPVEYPLRPEDAVGFLEGSRATRAYTAMLIAGESSSDPLGTHCRAANGSFRYGRPNVALAGGGPMATDRELLEMLTQLREIARRLAERLAYAFIAIDATFHSFAQAFPVTRRQQEGGPQDGQFHGELVDALVLDSYPYQILGSHHLRRLGGMPPGGTALSAGKVEVAIGAPEEWLPGIKDEARRLLGPCLLRRGAGTQRLEERRVRQRELASRAPQPPPEKNVVVDEGLIRQYLGLIVPPDMPLDEEQLATLASAAAAWAARPPTPAFLLAARDSAPIGESPMAWRERLIRPVALHFHAPPPEGTERVQMPTRVLVAGVRWLVEDGITRLAAFEGAMHRKLELASSNALEFLAHSTTSGIGHVELLAERGDGWIRALTLTPSQTSTGLHLLAALSATEETPLGTSPDDDAVDAVAMTFRDIVRAVADDVSYAFVGIDLRGVVPDQAAWSWRSQGGEDWYVVHQLCDEFVPDAFAYQMLGPGHLAQLGDLPPGARALGNGRFELEVGKPADWMPKAFDAGRRVLAPCLPRDDEVFRLSQLVRVARALVRGGFPEAVDGLTFTGGPLDAMPTLTKAAILRLYPAEMGRSRGHGAWTETVGQWLGRHQHRLPVGFASIDQPLQFPVEIRRAAAFLDICSAHRFVVSTLAAGDPEHRLWAASIRSGTIALAVGGPDMDDDELVDEIEELIEVASALAPSMAYGYLDVENTFARVSDASEVPPWTQPGVEDPPWLNHALGPFPLQLLGTAHRTRLGNALPDLIALSDDRFILRVGTTRSWLRSSPRRAEVEATAMDLLRPILLDRQPHDDRAPGTPPAPP